MSIFTAVMIISVVSAYQSTYGFSLQSVGSAVYINDSTVGINESLVGNNVGLSSVNLFLLNKSFKVGPGEKSLGGLIIPLNLDKLNNLGYPTHNVSLGVSVLGVLAAMFFNLSKNFLLGKTIMPAPFDNFSVGGITAYGNGTGLVRVAFNYFLPIVLHLAEITITSGNFTLGNISLGNLSHGFNSITSTVNLPSPANFLNLTFQAGPLTWNASGVRVR